MATDPTADSAFDRLVDRWRGDHLGPEKDEGVGILWKEGGIVELFVALHDAAPITMAALADRLVAIDADDSAMRAFLDAWSRPTPSEREAALSAIELYAPLGTLSATLDALEPPMASRFRERIEAWLDLARGIEARATSAAIESVGPKTVSHAKFGRGRVVADLGDRARVQFEDGAERTLLWRFLTVDS